jgi:hypothetical protein
MVKNYQFTISILWDTQIFLKYLSKGRVKHHKLKSLYLDSSKKFNILKLDYTLEFCIKCDLIQLSDDSVSLSDQGSEIAALLPDTGYSQLIARNLLEMYIRTARPYWSYSLINGRQKSMIHVPESISDIFVQVGLYDSDTILIDPEIIKWWDRLATVIYSTKQSTNVAVGRIGERCSFLFEEYRTQHEPKWLALEDNGLGYDLLSQQCQNSGRNLCIEVKTCSSVPQEFFISKYEWKVASTKPSEEYIFHIWDITDKAKPKLYTPSANDMRPHIPLDVGVAEWESCSIKLKELFSASDVPIIESSGIPRSIYSIVDRPQDVTIKELYLHSDIPATNSL